MPRHRGSTGRRLDYRSFVSENRTWRLTRGSYFTNSSFRVSFRGFFLATLHCGGRPECYGAPTRASGPSTIGLSQDNKNTQCFHIINLLKETGARLAEQLDQHGDALLGRHVDLRRRARH